MYRLKQKQVILIGILLACTICCICYYVYAKEDTDSTVEIENVVDEQPEVKEQTKDEEEKILVHVSGAVNQEGVVELETNSRVTNAIEKARRC